MDLGLKGKVAIVAGGSRGIGLAVARCLAREGALVAIAARNSGPLEEARKTLVQETATDIFPVTANMANAEDVARLFAEVEANLGPAEIVIANAGSGSGQGGFSIGRTEWQRVLDENLFSAALVAEEALRRMCERNKGSLTFVGSIAGIEAIGAPVPYSAAKAALHMATKLYAQQVGASGVRVNAVAPGNVLFPGGSWEEKLRERGDFFDAYVKREVPLQRFGKAEEIADVVAFLASPRAGFVSGAVWIVDGGQTRG